jgi:hypothetical protein
MWRAFALILVTFIASVSFSGCCLSGCEEGYRRCNGDVVEQCVFTTDGEDTEWEEGFDCSAVYMSCKRGECV